jgi:hypothetical protein
MGVVVSRVPPVSVGRLHPIDRSNRIAAALEYFIVPLVSPNIPQKLVKFVIAGAAARAMDQARTEVVTSASRLR